MSFPTQKVVCQLLRDGPPKRNEKIYILLKWTEVVTGRNDQLPRIRFGSITIVIRFAVADIVSYVRVTYIF